MRIGKEKARFTIRIYDNRNKKTKSFVFDNNLKNVHQLANLIKELLSDFYKNVKGGKK